MSSRYSRLGLGLVAVGVVTTAVTGCTAGTSGSAAVFSPASSSPTSPPPPSASSAPAVDTSPASPTGSARPVTSASSNDPSATSSSPAARKPSAPKPPAAAGPIPVNKSINDPVMGTKGTILAYVPSFSVSPQTAKKNAFALDGKHVLLLELKVSVGTKYYTSLGSYDFYVLDGSGFSMGSVNGLVGKDMRAAGYQPLKDAFTGKTSTGWVAYFVEDHPKSLAVQYRRLAAKTSDGKRIPAKNINVKLPR